MAGTYQHTILQQKKRALGAVQGKLHKAALVSHFICMEMDRVVFGEF